MVCIKSKAEIEVMRKGGIILSKIIDQLSKATKVGTKTQDLEKLSQKLIIKYHVKPSFKNYKPHFQNKSFPATICISINDEVVHGIPGQRIIRKGDLVSLDLGICFAKFHTDMAVTVIVGDSKPKYLKLVKTTRKALYEAIKQAQPGNRVGDISWTIQNIITKTGFSAIRDCMGHGIGFSVHEEPDIPNFGKKTDGIILQPGMTLAIEPMTAEGDWHVTEGADGWTIKTLDRGFCAHFEHTIAVTQKNPIILTNHT